MARSADDRLAWDGVSFLPPAGWEFGGYEFRRGATQIILEDVAGRRAMLEWMRPARTLKVEQVDKAFAKREKGPLQQGDSHRDLSGLPDGWKGRLYRRNNGDSMILARFVRPTPPFFAFVRLYFDTDCRENPQTTIRQLARGFRLESGPLVPWQLYDMAVEIPRDFRLWTTSLEAGRKLLAFQRRFTRLIYWQFSLADRMLGESEPADWCASFLSRHPMVPGPTFVAEADGTITTRRRRWLPLPHFDELGRLCWRYRVGYRLDTTNNRLVLWLYNYRRGADLAYLPDAWLSEPPPLQDAPGRVD